MKQINKHVIFLTDSKRLLNYVVLILLTVSQCSCFQHFYQTNTAGKTDTTMLKKLEGENKYFIVHTPAEVFALANPRVDGEKISGDRNVINKKYDRYLNPEVGKSTRFPKREAEIVFSEVHLYTKDTIEESGHVKLVINQIFRVDVYKSDKAADKRSKVISIVGIAAVPIVAVGIAAIIASSADFSNIPFTLPL